MPRFNQENAQVDIYNTAIKMFAEKCSVEFLDLSYEFDVADSHLWS